MIEEGINLDSVATFLALALTVVFSWLDQRMLDARLKQIEVLEERVHGVEHRLLVRAVTLYAQGKVRRDPARPRRMIVDEGGS